MVLGMVLSAGVARAELTEADLEPTGQANEAYTDAASGGGLQTEIIYLRPSSDFDPDESVEIKVPETPQQARQSSNAARWTWGLILGAILVMVIVVIVTQGGAVGVSFRGTTDEKRSRPDEPAEPDPFEAINRQPLDQFLTSLSGMADRRQALILLVSRALERAADANQVRLGRAQTARDVLRILPRQWSHSDTMRRLVREAEIAHFGGRAVTEDLWQDCLSAAQPIFRTGRAAA